MSFFQCNKQIRQGTFLRRITNLCLTVENIIRDTDENGKTAFLHQRIGGRLLILFHGCSLDPGMKGSPDLSHGILLRHLHGASHQRKGRRKQNAAQSNGDQGKYISHTVLTHAPPG